MIKVKTAQELSKTFNINTIYAHKVFLQASKENFFEDAKKIIDSKPKPFVKWVGGKRQLLNQFRLTGLYPPAGFNPSVANYFEPFVGGGAVFFDLLPENAFLSDLNGELVTTFNVIKNHSEELILSLKKHEINKDYFLKIRERDVTQLSDLDIASRFIFLNRTCFNGMYRVNSKGKFNVPYGRYDKPLICDEDNLRKVSKVLKKVEIRQEDYKEVLKKADKGDFVYFDPPYFPVSKTASFTSYTNQSFLEKQQEELRDVFLKLAERGCYVMLSNSDTPFINSIYSGFKGIKITKVSAGRSINSDASKRGKISEVVITNY